MTKEFLSCARACVCVCAFMRALACFCTYLCARLFLLSCMREQTFREYKIATYHIGLDRHCHTMLGKEDKEFVINKNLKMLSLSFRLLPPPFLPVYLSADLSVRV